MTHITTRDLLEAFDTLQQHADSNNSFSFVRYVANLSARRRDDYGAEFKYVTSDMFNALIARGLIKPSADLVYTLYPEARLLILLEGAADDTD